MSQTVVPAPSVPAPNAPAPPGGHLALTDPDAQSQVNWMVAATRAAFRGTPGRLRLVALGVIFGCLVAGFGGAWSLNERHAALTDAKDTTQHLVQLQRIQINLLRADAAITNSFLRGGLEPPEQLETYRSSVDRATDELASAARASDADATALGAANTALARYTGLIEGARANNRDGKPIAVSYLTTASDLLDSGVLKPLEQRATADRDSVQSSLSRSGRALLWLIIAVVLGIGLLVWSQIALAQVTHRFINLPAAGASIVLIVVLVASAVAMALAQSKALDVRDGAYADTAQLAEARVGAFTAKRIEAFELIQQGSATVTVEDQWSKAMDAAGSVPSVALGASSDLDAYRSAHEQIRKLDDAGDYQGAVNLATALSTEKNSPNASFGSFDDTTEKALSTSAEQASSGLDSRGWLLVVFAILLVLAGVAAAIVGWFGVSLRMGEYR